MIRTLHRTRGASELGATGPSSVGPFGRWPTEPAEDDVDGEQHDQRQRHDTGRGHA